MTLPSGVPPVTHLPPTTDTNYYDNVLKEMLDAKKIAEVAGSFFVSQGDNSVLLLKKQSRSV